MFSGLVREFGLVRFYANNILCIESSLHPKIGDSIAVNGACLTAIQTQKDSFCVELASNTAKTIATENLQGRVHIEPALRLNDGLHGHIMQGHIDCVGVISSISQQGNQCVFTIKVPQDSMKFMVAKGSVCVDGISLTINSVGADFFTLVIIPHTMQNTLFSTYKVGRRVNIESDIITRSVVSVLEKMLDSKDIKSRLESSQDILDSIALSY